MDSGEQVTMNARITGTTLGIEGHGILSCMVYLDYGGSSQGFGGYAFDQPVYVQSREDVTSGSRGEFKGRRGCAFGMEFIRRILEVVGADRWEDLKGKHVRVRKTGSTFGPIDAIGNILKDDWFDPKALAAEFFPKGGAS